MFIRPVNKQFVFQQSPKHVVTTGGSNPNYEYTTFKESLFKDFKNHLEVFTRGKTNTVFRLDDDDKQGSTSHFVQNEASSLMNLQTYTETGSIVVFDKEIGVGNDET